MKQDNVERAWEAARAWNEGGIEALLVYVDPEVKWHAPRESMEPGTYHGHDGVRDYLGRLGEVYTLRRTEPIEVIEVDAERLITVIHITALSEKFATEINANWAWMMSVRDGKAIEVWIYTDRAQAVEAAGLTE